MINDKSIMITALRNWRDAMLKLGFSLEDIEQALADILNGEDVDERYERETPHAMQ